MKEWEKELYSYQLTPAPPKMPPQEYIEKYLAEKDDKYFAWYLHYNEKYINEKVKGYVQEYAMQGHFMDMKSAYIFGLLQALQNYDPEKGASFSTFQAYYTKEAIDDYIRTMRTGYTIPSGDEYALLRKAMALYAKYGYKSDDSRTRERTFHTQRHSTRLSADYPYRAVSGLQAVGFQSLFHRFQNRHGRQ